ncbi:Pin2-interacting protein X1 [Entomortierella parvispora]|uniref:Pin2-interacting protein X1 n=1 Tax=Entomortierella parvispora TaxID=205924 RepID=A0A9P3LUC7_9FUNG|nr:Pin2-interacting protein X1 [Entomortierella parvispora]
MSFAQKQMAKFGWNEGDGLGKNRDGIKKSISVVKKNDTKGLGGKLDKWDFAWWDHVFNKSASNIQVNKDESGEVKVEKQAPSDIQVSKMGIISTSRPAGPTRSAVVTTPSTMSSMTPRDDYAEDSTAEGENKPAPAAKAGPSWLFGFVKASATSAATEEAKRTNKEFTSSAASFAARAGPEYDALKAAEGDEYKDYSIKVSDKELFEACEGRTARKGARGEQPGKLGRVMKELLLDDGSVASEQKKEKSSSSSTKKEKEKKTKTPKEKKVKAAKEKKEKKAKEPKEKKVKEPKEKKVKAPKEKKEKKEKKVKEPKEKKEKTKKRGAEEDETPRPSKKSKKSKDE